MAETYVGNKVSETEMNEAGGGAESFRPAGQGRSLRECSHWLESWLMKGGHLSSLEDGHSRKRQQEGQLSWTENLFGVFKLPKEGQHVWLAYVEQREYSIQ